MRNDIIKFYQNKIMINLFQLLENDMDDKAVLGFVDQVSLALNQLYDDAIREPLSVSVTEREEDRYHGHKRFMEICEKLAGDTMASPELCSEFLFA